VTPLRLVVLGVLSVLIGCAATQGLHDQAEFDAQKQSGFSHAKPGPALGPPGIPLEVNVADVAAWLEGEDRGLWIANEQKAERERAWIAAELDRLAAEREAQARAAVLRPRVSAGGLGPSARQSSDFVRGVQ
jgi:hypothetical protein